MLRNSPRCGRGASFERGEPRRCPRSLTRAVQAGQNAGVDLSFSPAEEAFRAELRDWLVANMPEAWKGGEPPLPVAQEGDLVRERGELRRLAALPGLRQVRDQPIAELGAEGFLSG